MDYPSLFSPKTKHCPSPLSEGDYYFRLTQFSPRSGEHPSQSTRILAPSLPFDWANITVTTLLMAGVNNLSFFFWGFPNHAAQTFLFPAYLQLPFLLPPTVATSPTMTSPDFKFLG